MVYVPIKMKLALSMVYVHIKMHLASTMVYTLFKKIYLASNMVNPVVGTPMAFYVPLEFAWPFMFPLKPWLWFTFPLEIAWP
jgi:hypothetical protein